MCTALFMKDRYFGRNLDYDFSYGEKVTIVERNHALVLRHEEPIVSHLAFLGTATIIENVPLFYDGTNESGLSIAGLNFVGNTFYQKKEIGKTNLAQFEFIPYLLAKFKSVDEVIQNMEHISVLDTPFMEGLNASSLHYILADRSGKCIVIEFLKTGVRIYDNPVHVLTNNPPFDKQLFQLNNYQKLSNKDPINTFLPGDDLECYSRGMGALGLPGDLSSMSRFVKIAYTNHFSVSEDDPVSSITQFFHVLHSVEQQKGACEVKKGAYEITIYSSCIDTETGKYYYTTYNNNRISCIDMHKVDLDGQEFVSYPLIEKQDINYQN